MDVLKLMLLALRSILLSRAGLAAENLALRQQVAVLRRRALNRRSVYRRCASPSASSHSGRYKRRTPS